MKPGRLYRIGLQLASHFLPLILAEATARLIWSEDDLALIPAHAIMRPDATLFWSLRPNLDTPLRKTKRLTTNSLGLRNEEVAVPKPPHTFRILSLGESTTWGDQVNLEETYSKALERRLNQALGSAAGQRFEVINAGCGAYTL
jgi:hypothetical protein